LSLRSHEDYGVFDIKIEPNKNEGNFRAILRARIESGNENLRKHFETCGKNATFISWNIQNQIIEACDEIIIQKLITKINKAKFFLSWLMKLLLYQQKMKKNIIDTPFLFHD
jgi:hypothetical protein